ncbi:hypothetical protein ALC56_01966, partial [Trachymyrmex septentrionalis]
GDFRSDARSFFLGEHPEEFWDSEVCAWGRPDADRHLGPDQPRLVKFNSSSDLGGAVRDLELSVPDSKTCVVSTRPNRGKPIALETARFNRLGGTSEEGSGTDEGDEEKKEEVEEEEAGGWWWRLARVDSTKEEEDSSVRDLGRRGRETCVCNSAWLPSRMSDGGHAV